MTRMDAGMTRVDAAMTRGDARMTGIVASKGETCVNIKLTINFRSDTKHYLVICQMFMVGSSVQTNSIKAS